MVVLSLKSAVARSPNLSWGAITVTSVPGLFFFICMGVVNASRASAPINFSVQ